MTIAVSPICYSCTRARDELLEEKCDAYPDGIPEIFILSEKDHFNPHPGDHGLQFELKKKLPKFLREHIAFRKTQSK